MILQATPAVGQSRTHASPVLSVRVLPAVAATAAVETASPESAESPAVPAPPAPLAESLTPGPTRTPPAVVEGGPGSRPSASASAIDAMVATPSPSPAAVAAPEARPAAMPAAYPPLPAAPEYAQSGRLDPGPRPLDDITPDYPEGHHSRSGAVFVRILVAANGTLDEVSVAHATPPGLFDRAAVDAVRRTRFAPGQLLGVPVKSQMTIEIGFAEINRGAAVSGRTY